MGGNSSIIGRALKVVKGGLGPMRTTIRWGEFVNRSASAFSAIRGSSGLCRGIKVKVFIDQEGRIWSTSVTATQKLINKMLRPRVARYGGGVPRAGKNNLFGARAFLH